MMTQAIRAALLAMATATSLAGFLRITLTASAGMSGAVPSTSCPTALKGLVTSLASELKFRDILIEKLKHQLAGMRQHRFGTRSEALDQLALALEDEEIAASAQKPAPDDANTDQPVATPKDKPKRKPLPSHLPRNETVLSPGDVCRECGGKLKSLGDDVTEELEYIPGRFVVNRIVRPRMTCTCCERFHQAALPSRPIERGRPGPGLIAHVLVNKYADHRVPRTHRQRWRCGTVREMREGPSEPAIRCRLQTTASCCR